MIHNRSVVYQPSYSVCTGVLSRKKCGMPSRPFALSGAVAKKEWSYNSTPPCDSMEWTGTIFISYTYKPAPLRYPISWMKLFVVYPLFLQFSICRKGTHINNCLIITSLRLVLTQLITFNQANFLTTDSAHYQQVSLDLWKMYSDHMEYFCQWSWHGSCFRF
jgi:hypothetical protein